MFSKFKSIFYRHKQKLLVGGLLITGGVFLTRYARKRLFDWQEKKALEFIERNRKHSHFDDINKTCNQTIMDLSKNLLKKIHFIMNTEEYINDLKTNPGFNDKLDKWNQLKIQVFTKAVCMVYSYVILIITIRLQLNILGSYMYKNGKDLPIDIQEKYLSLFGNFLNNGIDRLKNTVEIEIKNLLQNITLEKQLRLSDIETIFWSLESKLDGNKNNPSDNLRSYILSDNNIPDGYDMYSSMIRDTADLLESEEVKYTVMHHVNRGFTVLSDLLSEFFINKDPPLKNGSINGEGANSNSSSSSSSSRIEETTSRFENPFTQKKYLAKLIPILNGLITQSFPKCLLHDLITSEKLQVLSANIYESLTA